MRRLALRLWPDSLFGRLVAILAAGMFAGQMLTGTIWFDTHDNRMLEIPARLFASRLADTLRLVDAAPDPRARDAVITALGDPRYRLRHVDAPSPAGT
ncbi:MAG: two-component sensor histidine kinase, partial [Burkholderia sp.]|nr:two-component sensor histidine kinase [Burkholderia sp.]